MRSRATNETNAVTRQSEARGGVDAGATDVEQQRSRADGLSEALRLEQLCSAEPRAGAAGGRVAEVRAELDALLVSRMPAEVQQRRR